jgi:hypothetical protein
MKKQPARRRRQGGQSSAARTALVVLRDKGHVLNEATVLERSFTIEIPDGGPVEVLTSKVKTIVYKNLPCYPTDMLRTISGSEFNGVIVNDSVTFKVKDVEKPMSFGKETLASIMWWD